MGYFIGFVILIGVLICIFLVNERVTRLEQKVRAVEQRVSEGDTPQEDDSAQKQSAQEKQETASIPQEEVSGIAPDSESKSRPSEDGSEGVVPEFSPQGAVHVSEEIPEASKVQHDDSDDLMVKFIAWMKEDWAMKLGALLILVAIGWFVTYAFANNWIGPVGRVALGIVFGVLVLALGWWRMEVSRYQGSIFTLLGGTIVLLVVLAAQLAYSMFTPGVALLIMFLSAAFMTFISVRFRVSWLALAGLIFAGIAPLLISTSEPNFILLFSYLLVVIAGTTWVVSLSGFRYLTGVALLIVWFYSFAAYQAPEAGYLLFYVYAFVALFFFTNSVGILKESGKKALPDLITATANGLFLISWILAATSAPWQTLILVIWMAIFLSGGLFLYEKTQRDEALLTYAGVAIALLFTATALELRGAAFLIAITAEFTILPILAYLVTKKWSVTAGVSYLMAIPFFFSLIGFLKYAGEDSAIFSKYFFSTLIFIFALFFLGAFFRDLERRGKRKGTDKEYVQGTFFATGAVFAFLFIWTVLFKWLSSASLRLIAITLESGLAVAGAYVATREKVVALYTSFILIIPLLSSFDQMEAYTASSTHAFGVHFFALLIFSLTLLAVGGFLHFIKMQGDEAENDSLTALGNIILVIGSLYIYFLIWYVFQKVFMDQDFAILISMSIYTIIGIVGYFGGLVKEHRGLQIYGAAVVLVVVTRLFFVDVWNMDIPLRIATFLIVGLLLISTAFYGRGKGGEKKGENK